MEEAISPIESLLYETLYLTEIKLTMGEPTNDFVTRVQSQTRF
uniref:Uncharacterized protein n=1 Tax=Lepeophtheirus salmonis TaxID=72036 RepID=A0A0K2UQU3_LEPSM